MSQPRSQMSAREFRRRCWMLLYLSPAPSFGLVLGFLALLFDFRLSEWFVIGVVGLGLAAVNGFVSERLRSHEIEVVAKYLGNRGSKHGPVASPGMRTEAQIAFQTLVDLPQRMQRAKLLTCSIAVPCMPPIMALIGYAEWLQWSRICTVVVGGLAASCTTSMMLFYMAKRSFGDELAAVAFEIEDPTVRAELVTGYSLVNKLRIAMIVPAVMGSLLVATTAVVGGQGALMGAVAFKLSVVCIVLGLSAWVFAGTVCSDLQSALTRLQAEAERMASGDLRRLSVVESEDELGELGRAFESLGGALRSTVGRVSAAADGVESTATEISGVVAGVSDSTASQFERIKQANQLMVSITQQVRDVSSSAQALNDSVDESSSSVIELGAAGDELNDTASVLSNKIDAVSDSIEQMVRSVKEVSSTTDELAAASEETSSSMEEMASAMRVVDTSAETTANLSRDVVEKAEVGQEKVRQTIVGMEAIREATDAAENVIRGLGARTHEIGGILDVIDDVAEETNLLALNAAIIAAQAGEQGRAFSVVADEIKELADRVLASTKEIGGLITNVQEESENAVGAIEAGSASVMSGVDLSAEAGRTLEEITDASRESGTRIGEIVASVREQTRAASHVVGLMERVRDSAEQIGAAGADQDRGNEVVYRSTLTMREVAQQVHRTTEEQSRGFVRIRESVEGVRSAVEQINDSLREQSNSCEQVAEFLEQVSLGTQSNEDAASRMDEAMRGLLSQAESLRVDVGRFRVS